MGAPDARVAPFLGRVLDENGHPAGTCFQVSPGVLVTAWHVLNAVDASAAGDAVGVDPLAGGPGFSAIVLVVDELQDLAVLRGDSSLPGSVPGLVPTDGVPLRAELEIAGVSRVQDRHVYRFLTTTGTWQGPVTRDEQLPLGRVTADAILPGMSGAPVLRSGDQMVLGVLSGRYCSVDGWMEHTGWVARTETLISMLAGIADPLVQAPVTGRPAELVLSVGERSVSLSGDGWQVTAGHRGISPQLAAAVSEMAQARARTATTRRDAAPTAQDLGSATESGGEQLALGQVGQLMAQAFLPAQVGDRLGEVLGVAWAAHMPVRLGVHATGSVGGLPWEALAGPHGAGPLALHPLVALYRRIPHAQSAAATPGPLRILVAIAAPESPRSGVLNYEHELRAVLAAVRTARQGHAQVRIVPFATTEAIRAELIAAEVHVLHLSGHGTPGLLQLEDAAGRPRAVTADQFADEAIPPGKMPAVIALSACYTDVAEADGAVSFAQRLCERGASAVVATETSITDSYATRVFARVYERLAADSAADVVAAVADARRAVHQELTDLPRPGGVAEAQEWAVLTVLARTGALSLIDPGASPLDAPWRTRPRIPELIDREAGEFVGRRRELRSWPAQLAGTSTSGIVIHGIGGIGKTTLASELANRYTETLGQAVIACHRGPAGVDTVLATITSALRRHLIGIGVTASPLYGALAACTATEIPWRERMEHLTGQILPGLPAMLLILDNFEDNLTGGPARTIADPDLAALLADLASSPGTTRLLITSRYPFTLPGHVERTLTFHQIAPLSLAETLKLIWALPALDRLDPGQVEQVWRLLGGHPRALEYLDALLAQGHGRFPDITRRLTTAVQHRLGDTTAADVWFAARNQLDAALAETVTLAADDIILGDLLTELGATPGALELLHGAAVYREPVDDNALLFQIGVPDPSPAMPRDRQAAAEAIAGILASAGIATDTPVDLRALPEPVRRAITPHWEAYNAPPTPPYRAPQNLERAIRACMDSSLLTVLADEPGGPRRVFVHRWTADELARAPGLDPGQARIAHLAAAHYWNWRVERWPQSPAVDIHDLLEARDHLLRAGESDQAVELSEEIVVLLDERGAWDQATAVARETLATLTPESDRRSPWLDTLGDLAEKHGDVQQAEQLYRQALAIDQRLAAAAPYNPGYQRGLSVTYSKLADLARDAGQPGQAEQLHRQALAIRERLSAAAPDNPGYQRGLSVTYGKLADLARDAGQPGQAEQLHRQALAIDQQLAAAAPDNPGYQRGLSVTYSKLADLARDAGQPGQAEQLHRQALAIDQQLAAAAPDNPGYQHDLSVTYASLADLARDAGQPGQAEQLHRQALAIDQQLAAAAPDNPGYQHDLAVTYASLADLARDAGQPGQAEQLHRQALAIRERLAAAAPDNPGYQQGLAVTFERLADLARDAGQPGQAEQLHRQALAIRERLAAAAPDNPGYQRGLSVTYSKLADLARDAGQPGQAEQLHRQALAIDQQLAAAAPDNPGYQQGLAVTFERLADLARDAGQPGQVEQLYRQALAIWERLAAAAPDNPGYQQGLAVTFERLADLARDAGQPGQVEQLYRQALAIWERLAAAAPDNPGYQRGLAVNYSKLADLAHDAGQAGQAEQLHRQALAIRERLAAAAPDNPGYQQGLSVTYGSLADLARDAGQPGQAEQLHRQALAIRERLAAAAPDNPGYQQGLAVTFERLADLARDAGQAGQAEQLHRQALAIWERLAAAAPDNPGYQRGLSVTYGKLADLARDAGQAEQLHRQALAIRERLAAAAPDNPGYQRGLSVTYGKLADLARDAGQPGQAEQLHRQALAIDQQLAAAAPDNPGYQRDLAVTYGSLADLARDAGQPGRAEQLHRQALAIDQQLAAAAPDNPGYQRDLAVTYGSLADLARDAGQPGQAEQLHRQALAIDQQLAAAAPDNPGYQRDLAVTYGSLADLARDAGQPGQAEQLHRQALAIDQRLAAAAPDNPGYQQGLSVTYGSLADLARDAGQPGQAEQLHRQALAIDQQLAAAAPDNPGYQRGLSVTYGKLADLARDAGQAEQLHRQALAIRERLAAAAPDNPGYQRDLSVTYGSLADLARDAGQPGQAEQLHRQALAIDQQLAAAAPDNPGYQHDLAVTFERLADLARDAGQPGQAEQLHRQALAIWERLAAAAPDNPGYQRGLSVTYGKLADLARDAGQAEQLHRQALAIRERLAAAAPDNPGYQRDLSVTYGKLADLARDAGQPGQAEQLHRQALAIWERLAAAAPDNPGYQNDLAVTYSKLADLALDAGQAEQLHSQALDVFRQIGDRLGEADTLQALGDLHVRTNRLTEAERSYDQALDLYQQLADRQGEASTLQSLGRFFAVSGEDDKAEAAFAAALDGFESIGDRYSAAVTLAYRGQHRVANHRAEGFRDWRRTLDLAIIEDSSLFGQVVMITVDDTRRMLQSGEADEYLIAALPGLIQTGPEDDASALSDEQNAAHAMAIAGFGVIRDLAVIRASGPPPKGADRSRLLETAGRFDEATGTVFGLAATAEEILMQVDVRSLDQPLAILMAEWVQTPTWDESRTFLNDNHRELLSAGGQAVLATLAEASPSNDTLALHVNLLSAARRDGVAAAYSQLLTELQAEEAATAVRGWLSLAPDWAASAAYHSEHADRLSNPAAIAALTQACWAEPGDPQLWLHLGLLLMGDQRTDGYASAANGEPDPFQEADALLAAGDLDRALAWSSLARARDSSRGALLMARIQLIRNEPDRAAEALTAATAQMSKDQSSEVLAAYDTLLQAQPGEAWRHAEHAAALQRAGRPTEALAAYDRAITLTPDNASFRFNKGDLLFDLGRFDEARPELLEVTRLRPDDVLGAQVLLGAIAWPADPEEAREHFSAATSSPGALLTPFIRALYHAIALAGLERAEEAAAQLEAARSARSADDVPDDSTKRLLEQLQTPPIPGLDDLRPFLQPADPGNAPEDQG